MRSHDRFGNLSNDYVKARHVEMQRIPRECRPFSASAEVTREFLRQAVWTFQI